MTEDEGTLQVKLGAELKQRFKEKCVKEKVTMTGWVEEKIRAWVDGWA